MAAERKHIWNALALVSLVLIVAHLIASFCARKVIGSYLLTIGIYGLAFWMLAELTNSAVRQKAFRNKIHWVIGILASMIFLHDTALRFAPARDDFRTYTEKNSGGFFYFSNYTFHNLWTSAVRYHRKPNAVMTDRKPEYRFQYTYNEQGWRSHGEMAPSTDADKYRILALGDSWTEGVGAPDSATWTYQLERNLRERYGNNYRVINAGLSGNDPFLEFRFLLKYSNLLQPDGVLLAINSSDVVDVINRGGGERFTKSDRIRGKRGPWWEFFYSGSFVLRKYLHRDGRITKSLRTESQTAAAYARAIEQIGDQLLKFRSFCEERNTEFRVVFLMHHYDFLHRTYDHYLGIIADNAVNAGIHVLPVRECFESRIDRSKDIQKYWWKLDYHHTPAGYALLADCLAEYY